MRGCGRSATLATHRHSIGITVDGEPIEARVVLVSNNAYASTCSRSASASGSTRAELYLYAPHGVLRSNWEERDGESFTVDARAGRLHAAVDGEPEELETPIEFRVEPRALRVLLPRRPAS